MYSVYLDGVLLYAPNLVEEGYAISSCRVDTEINKAGSFRFVMPPSNPCYDSIHLMTSVVTVLDGDEEIFRGRPVNVSRDFYNNKTVYCEGWLAVLLDSVVRPYNGGGSVSAFFQKYITDHNNMVSAAQRLTRGTVTVTDPNNYIVRGSSDYPRTWGEIEDKLIELLGGYVRLRRENGVNYIDYLADFDSISDQVIEFGSNLLTFDEFVSAEDLFTAIIPLGARDEETEERIDITSVNDGFDYLVDASAAAIYGIIWHTEYWDDVTIPSNLKAKAQELLNKSVSAAVSLEMRAFDLHLLNVDTDAFKVGDMVRVVSLPHGVDDYFMCNRIERDLLRPDNSSYTFGLSYKTLTGQTKTQLKTVSNTIQSVITTPPKTEIIYRAASGAYWGDVNGDGNVNANDSNLIQRYINGETVTLDKTAADLNDNGDISASEGAEMINLIAGLPADKIIVKVIVTVASGSKFNHWQYLDRSADLG